MSDVTAASGTSTAASSTTASPATPAQFGEEFNSFIQLLTAQVRHQDPLSPMDSTQFVEQLATFSTLEQQVRSNQSLESIATMISDLHSVIASDWLGQKVSVESSWVPYAGAPVEFTADLP
ncbi:MAG: flagellar biosynthesis protein FlgD, partial [Hyphomonadaceae bacterium]|nr:flagellar biosynthesis protein FlgD [Hyphomonadaceae bacterium]